MLASGPRHTPSFALVPVKLAVLTINIWMMAAFVSVKSSLASWEEVLRVGLAVRRSLCG